MTSKSERELQNEIAYLTKLIEAHKRGPSSQRRPNPVPKHKNKFKWTASCQGEKCAPSVAKDTSTHVPPSFSYYTSQGQAKKLTPKLSHPHSSTHHYHPHRSTHHIHPHPHPHHSIHHYHPHSSTHHVHPHPHPHNSTHHYHKSPTKRGNLVFVPSKAPSPKASLVQTDFTKQGNLAFVPSKAPSPKASLVQTDFTKQGNMVFVPSKAPSPKAPPVLTDVMKWGNLVFVPSKVQSPKPSTSPPDSGSKRARTLSETRPSCSAGVLVPSPIAQSSAAEREGGSCDMKSVSVSKRPLQLPSKAQLKWKRQPEVSPKTSTAASKTTPTPKSPHLHGNRRRLSSMGTNSRYKWKRRRSHSGTRKLLGPKSPLLKNKPYSPAWVVHNRYKLTHASILHKYKLFHRQRQRHSSLSQSFKLGRSPIRHTATATPRVLKKTRSKNRVWLAGSGQSSERLSPVARRGGGGGSHGREMKTRQGNRLWVAGRFRKSLSTTALGTRRQSQGEGALGGGGSGRGRGGGRRRGGGGGGRGRGRFFNQLVSLSGQKFVVDSGGRRMKRLSSSVFSTSSSLHRARIRAKSVSESSAVKHYLASRAVQRSRQYVWSAKQKRVRMAKEAKQYCIFYNRFGKCNRGKECPYTHDPDKVAICTKFLRGICDKTDGSCPFSHTLSKEKMPTCFFFLHGVCTREDCPYLHVSVGRNAKVCYDFARGYCPNGDQCTKKHILVCPEFSKEGSCPRGSKCPLKHKRVPKKLTPETKAQPVLPTREPVAFRRLRPRPDPESDSSSPLAGHGMEESEPSLCDQQTFIPLDPDSRAPDFIAL